MMRRFGVLAIVTVLTCSSAVMASPITGTYKSPDLGSDILNGRWSESFAGGGEGQAGNIINAASWNGSALGTEWTLSGPTLTAASLLYDNVNGSGSGTQGYLTEYSGGVLTLMDDGPWWQAGDAGTEYLVDIDVYEHTTTMTFSAGELTDLRTTVYLLGTFRDDPEYTVEFLVATAVQEGSGSGIPQDYPAYLDATDGHWGLVQKINMRIIPEPITLSLLALGGLAVLRRRNS